MSRLVRGLVPALLLLPFVIAAPADATPGTAKFSTTTVATSVAARSDRRPVAGGLYDGKARQTFISWAGKYEDNYVQAYDHRTAKWSAPVRVGDGDSDSHNYPTMIQAPDGHLLVFRGMHNVELRMSRSPQAHSAEGVWEETLVSKNAATYPMPFVTRDGTIFVFYRETSRDIKIPGAQVDDRPMLYMVSKDSGKTWKSSKEITGDNWAIGSTLRPDNMNEIYIGQLRLERNGRVRIVYTLAGGGTEGHLHDRYHRNIYYTWFDPRNLHFYSVTGRDLGTQIDDADQENYLKVAETPLTLPNGVKSPDYIQLVGTTLGQRPFLLWFTGDDAKGPLHNYMSTWNGRAWETREVARGLRTRDMEQLDPFTWRVYATEDGKPNVNTYLVKCGKWTPESVIPTAKPVQRVEIIDNFRDPVRALFSGASSDRDVAVADGDITVAGFSRR